MHRAPNRLKELQAELSKGAEVASAALDRVYRVAADPRPVAVGLSAGAPGWERWQVLVRRLRGGGRPAHEGAGPRSPRA